MIKMAITKPSINCGNAKYSIADLCGFTHPDPENGLWESRKNILTAITDYKTYMTDNIQGAVDDLVKGLNYKQKETLVAIAKEGKACGVTSVAFVKKHALKSASSVQYAISTLLEDQLLTYEDDGRTKIYSVADRFLGYWIRKNY